MSDKAQRMREVRKEFRATVGFMDRWRAITLLSEWAKQTGDFHTVEAAYRFMEFINDGGADG